MTALVDQPASSDIQVPGISARRRATVRRLMLTGVGIFVLISASEFFVVKDQAGLVFVVRGGLSLLMLGMWWAVGRAGSAAALTLGTCLELFLIAAGSSLSAHVDETRIGASLNAVVLLIVVSGPFWPKLRHFTAGVLSCAIPPFVSLALLGAPPALWYEYAVYVVSATLAALLLWSQRVRAVEASARLRAELERRAVSDELTGILNRAGWNDQAPVALATAVLAERPSSLLYLDLDHFKSINDRHGHATGDQVIEHAAELIRREVRQGDLVARLGGEEFAVLLPGAPLARAAVVAERIRGHFEDDEGPVPATLSVGIAECLPDEPLEELMARADQALLRAKRAGRNRVEQARLD